VAYTMLKYYVNIRETKIKKKLRYDSTTSGALGSEEQIEALQVAIHVLSKYQINCRYLELEQEWTN
jgi:hypothetical protein